MPAGPAGRDHDPEQSLTEIAGSKEARKIRAQREKERSLLFGLGMFGLVGWSIAIPALLCTALGLWIDSRVPGRISWTLTFLFVGVGLGCLNAWFWVSRESRHE